MSGDLVSIVEAAYDVEHVTPEAWLTRVMEVARPRLDLGDGITGYFVDCSDGGFVTSHYQAVGQATTLRTLWDRYNLEVPIEGRRAIHMFAPAGYNGRLPTPVGDLVHGWTAEMGQPRTVGINAIDATLVGCSLAGWSLGRAGPEPTDADVESFTLISAHLAAGARLVHRLAAHAAALEGAEAVLDVDGRVVHAERDARERLCREALREAAIAVDRARAASRRSEDGAVEGWQALVAGRWSLLDHFDRDGRRFFVAAPNAPSVPGVEALTPREQQVANAAALGHSDKLIAYELGIGTSTVSSLLTRVRQKLGVRTRVELVRKLREKT